MKIISKKKSLVTKAKSGLHDESSKTKVVPRSGLDYAEGDDSLESNFEPDENEEYAEPEADNDEESYPMDDSDDEQSQPEEDGDDDAQPEDDSDVDAQPESDDDDESQPMDEEDEEYVEPIIEYADEEDRHAFERHWKMDSNVGNDAFRGTSKFPAKFKKFLRGKIPLTPIQRNRLGAMLATLDQAPKTSGAYKSALVELRDSGLFLELAGNLDELYENVLGLKKNQVEPLFKDSTSDASGSKHTPAASKVKAGRPAAASKRGIGSSSRRTTGDAKCQATPSGDHELKNQALPAPNESGDDVEHWINRLTTCVGRCAESIVNLGLELTKAKAALGFGKWEALMNSGRLPFSPRTAQKFMQIAKNPALSKANNYSFLPATQSTLSVLSTLEAEQIEAGISDGKITHEMTIGEAKSYVESIKGSQAQSEDKVVPDLETLLKRFGTSVKKIVDGVPSEMLPSLKQEILAMIPAILP